MDGLAADNKTVTALQPREAVAKAFVRQPDRIPRAKLPQPPSALRTLVSVVPSGLLPEGDAILAQPFKVGYDFKIAKVPTGRLNSAACRMSARDRKSVV